MKDLLIFIPWFIKVCLKLILELGLKVILRILQFEGSVIFNDCSAEVEAI